MTVRAKTAVRRCGKPSKRPEVQQVEERTAAESRLAALHEINDAVSSTLELQSILDLLLEKVEPFFPHCVLVVRLVDEASGALELAASRNLAQKELPQAVQLRGSGLASVVFKSKRCLTVTDLQTDPRSGNPESFHKHGLRSYLGVPLIAKNRALGTLSILTRESREFSPEEIEFASMLAGHAAVAIHNGQLHAEVVRLASDLAKSNRDVKRSEEIQRIVKEVSQDITVLDPESLLQKIAEKARDVLMVDQADARLLTEQGPQHITPQSVAQASGDWSSWPRWKWIRENRRPLMIPDITQEASFTEGPGADRSGMRGYLAVPIFSRNGDVIGVLRALSRQPRIFTQTEIDLLQQLANGAAIAVENARLLEETKQRAQEQQALSAIAAATSQSLHLDEILQIALDKVLQITGREKGYIRLRGPVSGELRLVAHRGISEGHVENLLRGRTPGGKGDQVRESGRSLVVNDTEGTLLKKATIEEGNRSIAWIPMKARGEVVGILNVSTSQPIPFTPSEVNLLEAIGSVIGNAVENAQLYEETERRRREAEELARVAQSLKESLDMAAVGERIVTTVRELFSVRASTLRLLQPDGSLRTLASSGEGFSVSSGGAVLPTGAGLANVAVAEGRPIWSADVLNEPKIRLTDAMRDFQLRSGNRSMIAVPLCVHEKTIGSLGLADRTGRIYSDREVALLQTFADQAALAVENAQLYEETKKQAMELEKSNKELVRREEVQALLKELSQDITTLDIDSLLKKLTQKVQEVLRVDVGDVVVLADEYRRATSPEAVDLRLNRRRRTKWIMEHRRPLVISDVTKETGLLSGESTYHPGTRGYLGVPLFSRGGETIGVLRALTRQAREFTQDEIDLLQQLASGAAIAIENARLLEETKQRAQEQAALNAIAAATSQSLHLDEILQIALDKVLQITGREKGYIRLRDPVTGELRLAAHRGISEGYVETLLHRRTPGGKSDQVFESGQPLIVNDPEGTLLKKETLEEGSRSIAWVPMKARGQVVGILNISTSRPIPFTPSEVNLLEAIGSVIGNAVENAHLFEETHAKAQEMSALYDVVATVSQSLELDRVLREVIQKIMDIFHFDATRLYLSDPRTDELHLRAALDDRPESQHYVRVFRPGQGNIGRVFATGKPVIFADVHHDPRYRDFTLTQTMDRSGFSFLAAFPIKTKLRSVGVLSCIGQSPRNLTPEEVRLLSSMVDQIGVAVENAQLYEETKKQAVELERSSKVKDEFLSVMSHELRTPLTAIIGYAGMLQDGFLGEITPEQARALGVLLNQTGDLLALINSILEVTKIGAGTMVVEREEVDLKSFLDELRSTYDTPRDKSLALIWDYDGHLPSVTTDGAKLKRILQNLVNNAIKFTDEGNVTISARVVGRPKGNGRQATDRHEAEGNRHQEEVSAQASRLSPHASKSYVEFKVADTGIGIPKQALPVIFEKFRQVDNSETRPYGGVGLGLHIVKEFTEMLGGTVKVDSEPGKGSVFTVTIPVEPQH